MQRSYPAEGGRPAPALFLSDANLPARPGHVPSLDGLRALSISLVLLSHFVNDKFFPGGFGVYIFFVISGFLITRLLLSERKQRGDISLRRFYMRRVLRLYPVLLVYTVLMVALMLVKHVKFDYMEPISTLFYFANYLYSTGRLETAPFQIFWSLSVEEHFYFLLPTAMLLIRSPARLLVAMVGICVGCLAIRLIVATLHPELLPEHIHYFYYRTECRMDSLAFGVGIACLCETDWGRRFLHKIASPIPLFISLIVLAACFLIRDQFVRETIRYTMLGLGISVFMIYVLLRKSVLSYVFNHPLPVWIGTLSYSLYIWEYPFLHFDYMLPSWPKIISAPVFMTVTFIISAASYYGLEKPLVQLRARLGGASPRPIETEPSAP